MNNLPKKVGKYGSMISNLVKAIGPLIISQAEIISEEYVKHKEKLASVDVAKELMVNEGKALLSVKEQLLKNFSVSDDVERVRIKRDLREIEQSFRALKIGQKALSHLCGSPKGNEALEESVGNPEISDSWLDRFYELAKLNNEPWREELLAKALAKEAGYPGSVSPRALWLLGTLEEDMFRAFSAMLDASIFINSDPMIPNGKMLSNEFREPSYSLLGHLKIGHLVCMLGDTGLVSDTYNVQKEIKKGCVLFARYGDEEFLVKCVNSDLKIKGVIYTGLGNLIASFCDVKPNKIGEDVLHGWLDSLSKDDFEIKKLSPQS